jgi:beta-lactamase superfamily II metal-dependent hydrolase
VLLGGLSIAVATYPFRPDVHTNDLEVTVIDVGQGDSIFVVSPKGSTLLIDGGGAFLGFRGNGEHFGADPGEEAVSAYLWSRGFQRIDTIALTHAHQDHIGGLTAVLQNFRVSRLWLGLETSAPAFLHLKQVATGLHVPIEQERRGQSFSWDDVQVDFLWPEPSAREISATAKNNDSLVVRLRYGDRTILLPGDAEKQVEYTMLAENDPRFLHADVLKVGHHGSKKLDHAAISGCREPADLGDLCRRGKSVRTSAPGASRPAARKRHANSANRPRWSRADPHRRSQLRGQLFSRVSSRSNRISERAGTRSQSGQSAIAGIPGRLGIRGFCGTAASESRHFLLRRLR